MFVSVLPDINFDLWRVTFFKTFLPLTNYGMNIHICFSGTNGNNEQDTLHTVTDEMWTLEFSKCFA